MSGREKCEVAALQDVASNTAVWRRGGNAGAAFFRETVVTVTLRCLNCGFSFTVTYPTAVAAEEIARPVACGHCRSTNWSSQAG